MALPSGIVYLVVTLPGRMCYSGFFIELTHIIRRKFFIMEKSQDGPFVVEVKAGQKKAWCSCGESSYMPSCDGTHASACPDKSPVVVEYKEDTTVHICGCGKTNKPPYCDGSHKG